MHLVRKYYGTVFALVGKGAVQYVLSRFKSFKSIFVAPCWVVYCSMFCEETVRVNTMGFFLPLCLGCKCLCRYCAGQVEVTHLYRFTGGLLACYPVANNPFEQSLSL